MPLESCMILLDNSEYMRNGDYVPTRMEAQHDAANLLVGQKTQSNPESTVGVIAMSGAASGTGPTSNGKSPSSTGAELLVSPTDDMGKILSALHGVPIRGRGDSADSGVDVAAAVQVASLALKHRRNKNGAQRVVLFVGSPLSHVEGRALAKAGRQLKKNNVYIDVVALGELEENEPKLQELVDAANGSTDERMCHLVTIPAGVLPSDVLVSSPIVHGGGAGGAGAGSVPSDGGMGAGTGDSGLGAFAEFGGIDPNMDPELAMALRVSMEEERARQERARAAAASASESTEGAGESKEEEEGKEEGKESADAPMDVDQASGGPAAAAASSIGGDMNEDDALLQQAIAMSMRETTAEPSTDAAEKSEDKPPSTDAGGDVAMETEEAEDDDDEDAAMQMALQMSMQQDAEDATAEAKSEGEKKDGEKKEQFQDPQFVNQLLGSLPGVDPNDPAIQNALKNLKKEDGDDKDKKDGASK